MTYFLVMGSLALSVLFMLGWTLSRLLRWIAAGFPLETGNKKAGRKPAKRSGATRKTSESKTPKSRAPKDSAAAKSPRSASAKSRAQPKPIAKAPSQPWRITRQLAKWHGSTAFAVVAAFLYLVARLAEHGMSFRPPHTLPSGFTSLVSSLGWLAAGLILLSCLHTLAKWRCNRAEEYQ